MLDLLMLACLVLATAAIAGFIRACASLTQSRTEREGDRP